MKCPSCGRMMMDMVTFFKCSNGYCDYEEDIETQPIRVSGLTFIAGDGAPDSIDLPVQALAA